MKNWRVTLVALVAVPVIAAAMVRGVRPVPAPTPAIPAATLQSCADFQTQARTAPPAAETAFVTMLAEACHGAIRSVRNGADARESTRALAFLSRLTEFRRTIDAMNAERLRTALRAPGPTVSLVSDTGAWLIAREMGLFRAWKDWAEASDTTLATRLGH